MDTSLRLRSTRGATVKCDSLSTYPIGRVLFQKSDFHRSMTAYNLWRFREDNQMVDSKTFTQLTPEQTADWEYYFQLYRDTGYTGAEVSAKAWKDLCSKYPELANAS